MFTSIPTDQIMEKLNEADRLLAEWLTDNTVDVFEEQPEVDSARGLINDVMDDIREALDPRGIG